MNEKVNQMVELLFKDILPSEEVQALHDEVLNNCQDRFADLIRSGLSEEESLAAVMESLKGMDDVLKDYPRAQEKPAEPAGDSGAAAAEKAKPEPTLMHFSPEDIRAIDAQLTDADIEIQVSDSEFSLETKGDVRIALEKDGTLRLWQESVPGALFKGISWEDSFNSFERFGDALNQLGQNLSTLMSRGFGLAAMAQENLVLLKLPRSIHPDARLRTTSGDILWKDVIPGSVFILRSTSGDIRVFTDPKLQLPSVQISTMSGDAEVVLSAEEAKISSVSGDVDWNGDAGFLELNSTSGDVEAVGSIRKTVVNTTSGDLSLELISNQPAEVTVNSVSGDIDVRLPASVEEICASLKSVSGNIRRQGVELADEADIHVRANTVSGSLKVYN